MSESEKLIEVEKLLAQWKSGELSSYDFAAAVEKLVNA